MIAGAVMSVLSIVYLFSFWNLLLLETLDMTVEILTGASHG